MNIKEVGDNFTCDCGFSWQRGRSGKHECADGLRAKLAASVRREKCLNASIDVLSQRLKDLEAAAIVPGVLRCAKCNYELMLKMGSKAEPSVEQLASLACDNDHLNMLVTLWAENTLVHQLAARLLAVREAQSVPVAWQFNWHNEGWRPCKNKKEYDEIIKNGNTNFEVHQLYTAPPAPAPAVTAELLDAMAEVIRISDRDHEAWDRAKGAISACRAAKLVNDVTHGKPITSNSPVIPDGCGTMPTDYFSTLVNAARPAADKAMRKHPQPNYVLLKVAEEAGEVVQAAVHYAEGRMTWQDLEGEIVQLLAMLIRLVTEGDQVNGIKPPASCSTAALATAPDEIDIFVDQVCGNLPAGHQQ